MLYPYVSQVHRIGKHRPKTFLIQCDGEGTFSWSELKTPEQKLEVLEDAKNKNLVRQDEYEEIRKKILDQFF